MQSFDQFLSSTVSLGGSESPSTDSEYTAHNAADLDVKFLLALLKQRHHVASLLCIPDFVMCVTRANEIEFNTTRRDCLSRLRSGVMVTRVRSPTPLLHMPSDLRRKLDLCAWKQKRFMVLNMGLYPGDELQVGHANALVFDLRRKMIERYEPSGLTSSHIDGVLKRLFAKTLPSWSYVGHRMSKGAQELADSFDGMCVTFSLLYVLMRLLNPDVDPGKISRVIVADRDLKVKVLKLNRFVVDTLRGYRRGSLVRHLPDEGFEARVQASRVASLGTLLRSSPSKGKVTYTNWAIRDRHATFRMLHTT